MKNIVSLLFFVVVSVLMTSCSGLPQFVPNQPGGMMMPPCGPQQMGNQPMCNMGQPMMHPQQMMHPMQMQGGGIAPNGMRVDARGLRADGYNYKYEGDVIQSVPVLGAPPATLGGYGGHVQRRQQREGW